MASGQFNDVTQMRAAGCADANFVAELTAETGVFAGSLETEAGMVAPVAVGAAQTAAAPQPKKNCKRPREVEAPSVDTRRADFVA